MLYGHDFDKNGNEVWQLMTENVSEEQSIDDLREALRNPAAYEIRIHVYEHVGDSTEVRILAVPITPEPEDHDEEAE